MTHLPAKTGWLWLKEGFALFRKQPVELSTLFISYMFIMIAIGIVPLLGQVAPLILVPVFSMAFLSASAQVRNGERVFPKLLFVPFRSPAIKALLLLGVLQLATGMLALGASVLVDGGVFWKVISGQTGLDPKVVAESNMGLAILAAALVYLPASMAFWYAAPLVAWQKMGVVKAVFYSFFAVQREFRAFLVYGLAWVAVGVILPTVTSLLLALIFNSASMIVMVMMPLSMLLTVVLYSSFYITYTDVFPVPEQEPVKAAGIDIDV
ncbi:BPSS1780 family membrane protein [Actimicrobium antarcticum]|uniref:Transmembrane protein n=1 Tax=Actimicrobium antarcticum TaxID=1051899 RepID=A0ABP7SMG9_9BURK